MNVKILIKKNFLEPSSSVQHKKIRLTNTMMQSMKVVALSPDDGNYFCLYIKKTQLKKFFFTAFLLKSTKTQTSKTEKRTSVLQTRSEPLSSQNSPDFISNLDQLLPKAEDMTDNDSQLFEYGQKLNYSDDLIFPDNGASLNLNNSELTRHPESVQKQGNRIAKDMTRNSEIFSNSQSLESGQIVNYDDSELFADGTKVILNLNNSTTNDLTRHPESEPKEGNIFTVSCPQCNHVFKPKIDEPINGKFEIIKVNFTN